MKYIKYVLLFWKQAKRQWKMFFGTFCRQSMELVAECKAQFTEVTNSPLNAVPESIIK